MKKALITGITGQDGSYLAELLLDKGYEVHGLVRRVAIEEVASRFGRISHILQKLHIKTGAVTDYETITDLVTEVQPDEIYHLAAQSHVGKSFADEFGTWRINLDGTLNILRAVEKRCPTAKVYFAATSEMFGNQEFSPLDETRPFYPVSPYGISKVAATQSCRMRRENGLFVCCGILFNHESPRRGEEFVTRKITKAVARIAHGFQRQLVLGNLNAVRDWGYAPEYVEAMWQMLQQANPEDYVIATGSEYAVVEFMRAAFAHVGLDHGKYVKTSDHLFRPNEIHRLCGSSAKALSHFGWRPRTSFNELVAKMVDSEMADLDRQLSGAAKVSDVATMV